MAHLVDDTIDIELPALPDTGVVRPELASNGARCPKCHTTSRRLRIDIRTRSNDDPQPQLHTELEERLECVDAGERDLASRGLDEAPVRVDGDGVETCCAELGEDVAP